MEVDYDFGRCVEVLLVSFSFALVFRWHRDSVEVQF